jgi:hypothetical protein
MKTPKKDHIGYRGYWILVEKNYVSLNKQKPGEPRTEKIAMPKSVFNRFIKFYQTGE